jgi:predicted nucleic acid-binding protein
MKYLDSNIFIYPLLYNDKIAEYSRRILSDVVNGKISACTSVLTWDELVHSIGKIKGKKYAILYGEKFLNFSRLVLLDANPMIILTAQGLIKKYGLYPRDAIHAATSIYNKTSEIISNDKDFDNIKEIKRIDPKNYK